MVFMNQVECLEHLTMLQNISRWSLTQQNCFCSSCSVNTVCWPIVNNVQQLHARSQLLFTKQLAGTKTEMRQICVQKTPQIVWRTSQASCLTSSAFSAQILTETSLLEQWLTSGLWSCNLYSISKTFKTVNFVFTSRTNSLIRDSCHQVTEKSQEK